MKENDIRAEITIPLENEEYTACLKLGTLKAFEADTGIGVLAFWEQCRLRTAKLTDQATLLTLALKASHPTWGNNKIAKVLDRLTVTEHLIYASALLNFSVLEPSDAVKKAAAAEESAETADEEQTDTEDTETSPLH